MSEETITHPTPEIDGDSAPYWAALKEHRAVYQHCNDCGGDQLYFRAVCKSCWSRNLVVADSSGKGTIYTWTVVRQTGDQFLAEEVPYVLAMVEMEEGPLVLTRIDGAGPDEVAVGDPVEATFRDIDDDVTLLYYRKV